MISDVEFERNTKCLEYSFRIFLIESLNWILNIGKERKEWKMKEALLK
jgi:hypothetical protein